MSNYRWCFFIHLCQHSERRVTVPDPSEQIAAWETDKTVDRNDNPECQRVYTPLPQTHLRTLVDADISGHENGTVELSDRATKLVVPLNFVQGGFIPWGEYYLGPSVIEVGSLGNVAIGFLPTTIRLTVGWAALAVSLFAGSAAAHDHQSHQLDFGVSEARP